MAQQKDPWVAGFPGFRGSASKGTALFKLKSDRPDLFTEASAPDLPVVRQKPPGFRECETAPGWLFNPDLQVYLDTATGKRFGYETDVGEYYPVHTGENRDSELSVAAEASTYCSEALQLAGAPPCRKVFVLDLHRAALALKQDITHLDRPAAVMAVFSSAVAGATAGSAVESTAKGFPVQLLKGLASYRGEYTSARLEAALSDAVHRAGGGEQVASSVCVAAALVLGTRLTSVAIGEGSRCLLSARSGEPDGPRSLVIPAKHSAESQALAAALGIRAAKAASPTVGSSTSTTATASTALGAAQNAALPKAFAGPRPVGPVVVPPIVVKGVKAAAPQPEEPAPAEEDTPATKWCFDLAGARFQSLTLMAGAAGPSLEALTNDAVVKIAETAATSKRPRLGCRTVIEAARKYEAQGPLIVGMVPMDWAAAAADDGDEGPPAKKPRLGQVRVRHILLKYVGCTVAMDKARNRKVKRSLQDAEGEMHTLIGLLDANPSKFTAKVRERSECQSALKGGELAGDLGWIAQEMKGVQPEVHKAAFSLDINQLSDMVVSKDGVHVLLRTA